MMKLDKKLYCGTFLFVAFIISLAYFKAIDPEGLIRAANANKILDISAIDTSATQLGPVAFSPDGGTIASVDSNARIVLWGVATGQVADIIQTGSDNAISELKFGLDSSTLASLSNNVVQLWHTITGSALLTLFESLPVTDLAFSPDGRILVSVGMTSHLTLWNAGSGEIIDTLAGLQSAVTAIAFSPDSRVLAISGKDPWIVFWDIEESRELIRIPTVSGETIADLVYSPDGNILASMGAGPQITLRNSRSGSTIQILNDGQKEPVATIEFSPDSSVLAAGLHNGQTKLWDVATGLEIAGPAALQEETDHAVTGLLFNAEGSILASFGESDRVSLWSLPDNRARILTGHSDWVVQGAFSSDSRTLATIDGNGLVIVWNLETGFEELVFDLHGSLSDGAAQIRGTSLGSTSKLGQSTTGSSIPVLSAEPACPCNIWPTTATPGISSVGDSASVELGVKFRSDVDGYVTGIRFYKGSLNSGTHVGNLWSTSGTRLATATFSGETASGWQEVSFANPVQITANTVYVASYFAPNGGYAFDGAYFSTAGIDNPPLHALQNGVNGGNAVFLYGSSSAFPTDTYNSANYWVDVAFTTTAPPAPTLQSIAVTPANATIDEGTSLQFTATGNYSNGSTQDLTGQSVWNSSNTAVATINSAGLASGVSAGTSTISATSNGITGSTGLTVQISTPPPTNCPCTIWSPATTPGIASAGDPAAVELGVKFRSDVNGYITGIRFYKGTANTGTHVGNLWSNTGTLLATGTFSGETASGWQELSFANAFPISANTVYIASYFAPNGGYAINTGYFATSGVDNGPLHALQNGVNGGNGVFLYGTSSGFPTNTYNSSNYWVDVKFTTATAPDTTPPSVTGTTPSNGATGVSVGASISATFSEAVDATTINSSTFQLRDASNTLVPATITYNAATRTAALQPNSSLTQTTLHTATIVGGSNGVKDLASPPNALQSDYTWSFTTGTDPCVPGGNPIVCENSQPGNPQSEWDVNGAGDSSIQGFATNISVNQGDTVSFKINTNAVDYRLDIYRLGYYGGDGARKVATVNGTGPRNQPACLSDSTNGLVDCGNWSVSDSWDVPADATSGIYFARAVRTDTQGASHIVFVVRDDNGHSDLLFQTSDTTWQAYNDFGGNSLYVGSPAGRAYKVSYNRPFNTRGNQFSRAWLFGAEYPMVRWLEANGYDVSYFTGVDTDRSGAEILEHRAFLSVGHDEYWSASQRANVEAARDAGVHLAFFSGDEVFWKTRWETSIDGSGTTHRTLVCYKETHANAKIDPLPNVWTGTWRDPRFSPPADGGRPENELTGTIFTVNCCQNALSITVPEEYGKMRFWRGTSIAALTPGQVATLPPGGLGYEWDEPLNNGFSPAGLVKMSSTTVNVQGQYLLDNGSSYGSGTATHNLTLHRHNSGALVFGAGTIRWSWGLDGHHDFDSATPGASTTPDIRMQQATVNLLADMGVQPDNLQPGLTTASQTTDLTAPTSLITSPTSGSDVTSGSTVVITGTANDAGSGLVANVEVSVNGGNTWQPAVGRTSWSYTWTPGALGQVTIQSRAVDDSGNLETPSAGITVNVVSSTTGATLQSITVTPANPTIQTNTAQQFTATGNYSDNSTQDLTGQATWNSSNTTIATIDTAGLATGVSSGTTTISATFGGVTGSTVLTVQTGAPAPNCPCNIWSPATTPGISSVNDTAGVELGVRFSPDVDGSITGIRFYKGSLNTGTHVGNLWSSTGTLLATATFTGETASGWQEVSFASPVAVTANTVYVASYFAPNGGYAFDGAYFATAGVDNPPLHAFQDGAAGGNGVFLYGSSSGFPTNSYNSSNYWVDVAFTTNASSATLQSIAVTPVDPGIPPGSTQQFAATGNYSDGSTQDLTGQVAWASSNTAVATIDTAGLANGVSAGTSTISATLDGVTGTTVLTVQTATLQSIQVTPADPGIPLGTSQQFTATGNYSDGSSQDLTGQVVWASSDTAVATIDSATGLATAESVGSSTISATLDGITGTTVLTVQPVTLESIAVTPANPGIPQGGSQQFTATGNYSDSSTQDLTSQVVWASSDTTVAIIDTTGLATGISSGSSTISATFDGVAGNTVLAVQGLTSFQSPTADNAVENNIAQLDFNGDGDGFEISPSNAYADDGLEAADINSSTTTSTSCTSSGNDKHIFYNYGFNVPAGTAIAGIEVRLDARADATGGAPKMCAQISWNGGNNWTAAKTTATLTTSGATYVLGGPTDTWGRAWTLSELSNSNFRVRIIDVASNTNRDFYLDWVAVRLL